MMRGSARTVKGSKAARIATAFRSGFSRSQVAILFKVSLKEVDAILRSFLK